MTQPLPRSVQQIADVIGRQAALSLVGQLPRFYSKTHPSGLLMLYVPKTLAADHRLVRLIGWARAQQLVRAFGGEMLLPAGCAELYRDFRDRSLLRLLREGHRTAELAEWFEVCERHIRKLKLTR